jgi:hypothetical protein
MRKETRGGGNRRPGAEAVKRTSSSDRFSLTPPFPYKSTAGAGFDLAVIDSAILAGHNDFGGRASWGKSTKAFERIKSGDASAHTVGAIIT